MLITGAALGSWRGATSLGLYLVIGMFLPVYAGSADGYLWQAGVGEYVLGFSSGSSGFIWQMASGGYIIGFVAAAWLTGFLCEHGYGSNAWALPVLLAGSALVYVPGLIQLSLFAPDGMTLARGLYPFIAGDLIKLVLAALLVPAAWGLANWFGATTTLTAAAPPATIAGSSRGAGRRTMDLVWLGHSSFRLHSQGMVVVTDPFPESLGLRLDGRAADIITVSNTHPNHSAAETVGGEPRVFRRPASTSSATWWCAG